MNLLAAVALLAGATPTGAAPLSELKPGVSIEGEIAGGERQAYRLILEAGTLAVVEVHQKGVDLVVTAQDPAGVSLGEVDFLQSADGLETFALIAEAAGDYRIGIRSSLADAPRGRYEVKLQGPRQASAKDRLRVQAQRTREEGVRLWRQRSAESMEQAIASLERARQLYRDAGMQASEARMLGDMGVIHWELGRPAEALARYEQSLPLRRAGQDVRGEAMTLSNMGLVYSSTGRLRQAVDSFHSALAIWRREGLRSCEGLTLHQL